jgi:hypothetical protein
VVAVTARRRGPLARDDDGSFLVLEAILVALLVLTAILFFTSVQRPSTGAGEGGLDLAQVAADTLQILQQRSFVIGGQAQPFNSWLTNATEGDAATAAIVDGFITEMLPTGAHYSLRLDNGVAALQVLPGAATETPRNARAAEIATLPPWTAFRNATAGAAMRVVTPGQVVDAADPLVSAGTYACYEAPYNATTGPGGQEWRARWQSAPEASAPTSNGKEASVVLGARQQVPKDLPLGKWRLSSGAALGGHCTVGTVAYVDVVPPGERVLSVTTASGQAAIVAAAGSHRFSDADVGLPVAGDGIPPGAFIASVQSSSAATLSQAASASGATTIVLPVDPTFLPYGVQLVVWFGA